MINKNYSVNFTGLNMSKVSAKDMKWLENKPWWTQNKEAISTLAKKYDIEISSASQNIGMKVPNNISILDVKVQHLNAQKGLFGSTFGTAIFDIDLHDIYKKADKTLLETVNKAIKGIMFNIFQ